MTARLSPAQQRVVGAMRDGSWLVIDETAREIETDAGRVDPRTVRALEQRGVIEMDGVPYAGQTRYLLAAAYRGGES